MNKLVDYISGSYNYYVHDQMDPRLKGYFLMDSPLPFLLIVFSYVIFVKWVGPWWMKDRPAYNVEKPMLVYNFIQMLINSHFAYTAMTEVWIPRKHSVICVKLNNKPEPLDYLIIENTHLFLLSRLLDFLDTVFMVLKKNNHQVTFLHVYHHLLVATGGWFIVKYHAGGNVIFFGTLNAFVHVVMYFYYFLTAYDPTYKKSTWWKKRITQLQIIQFIAALFQQILAFFNNCELPKYLYMFYLSQAAMMIYLFVNFYFKAYVQKKKMS